MGLVKWKGTTKAKNGRYSQGANNQLGPNWYEVRRSAFEEKGAKRAEITGLDDKWKITVLYCQSHSNLNLSSFDIIHNVLLPG